jgi:6-pyruvoyl-tetrahydropterin synthase related domain
LSSRWNRLLGPAVILLAAALASAPVALKGPFCGDDFQFHLFSWLDAQQSWRHGIPYPHWTPNANYGAGEPRFIFYPPLTWMLGAALGLILPWAAVPVVLIFLLLSATGLATYALARQTLAATPAILAGCAALFSVYALYTAYERAAFGELAGGIWIPLLLLFTLRDRNPSAPFWRRVLDGSALPLTLVVTGAWLSDVPAGVMTSYLLAAVALIAALLARSWVPIARASIAAVLGIGITALYLYPAAWEQRWVDVLQATGTNGDPGLLIDNNWLFAHSSNPSLQDHNATLHFISSLSAFMIAIALLSAFTLWLRSRKSPPENSTTRRWWITLALIPAIVLFLQFPISLPIWNLLPKLRFLQFPWRFLLVVEAPMAILFAAAIWPRKSWKRGAVAALSTVFFLSTVMFATRTFFLECHPSELLPNLLTQYHAGTGFWGADEYAPPGSNGAVVATGLPDACLSSNFNTALGLGGTPTTNPAWRPEQGSCTATTAAKLRQPEHLQIATTTTQPGYLILRLRSYPAWRVTVNDRPATNLPKRDDGLIAVPVPQGPIDLKVDWTTTPDVIIGRWLTTLSLLLLTALGFQERKLSRPRFS